MHNVAPHLLRPSGSKEESAGLHESLKLVAAEKDGTRFDLLNECTIDSLLTWLGEALPGDGLQAKELVAALYEDEDYGGAAGVWQPCLQMRLSIRDVGFLHELRDAVLTLGPNPNPYPNPNPKPN